MEGLEAVNFRMVEGIDDVLALREWLSLRRDYVVIDTETTGLAPHTGDRTRLFQIGDAMTGWAIPWEGWRGAIYDLLRDYRGPVLFHNAKFDMSFINVERELVRWSQVHDTRTLAWLVDPTRPTALKTLSDRYVDRRASAMQATLSEAMAKQSWTWETVPIEFKQYWAYGALDVVLTARVWEALKDRLPQFRRAYELEIGVLPIFARMEARGAYVDVDYAAAQMASFEEQVRKVRAWCTEYHGVSPSSPVQVIRRLQELGATLTKKTASGKSLAFDKEVKEELIINGSTQVQQLAFACRKVAQLEKLTGSYLRKIVELNVDGRIRGSINPIGAPKTGRNSVTGDMALQTLPRHSKSNPHAVEVRNCFIPAPGNRLAMVDFDQIEMRLFGHYAQDPAIMEILRDPMRDPFTAFAQQIYHDPGITKQDARRDLTKASTYAELYGAGTEKFALTAGITVAEAAEFRAMFNNTFPGMQDFKWRVESAARERMAAEGKPYVTTPWGHQLTCEESKLYKLVNRLIQGTAANVMKHKLIELDNAGLGEYMVLPVHDEVILDAPEGDCAAVAREASRIMGDSEMFTVPLRAGVDGPVYRWGEKYLKKG